MTAETHSQLANFIWSICNLLRGPYKRNEYRKVILPLTVLCRFDCILAPTKAAVLKEHAAIKAKGENIIRKSDMLIKGEEADNIILGDTFTKEGFDRTPDGKKWTFDYMFANPPFGVEWKQQQRYIEQERDTLGFSGRFGAGTPRVNDGALLFLQHMLAKMRAPQDGGSRIAIVFNGSPLFTGDAGGGESDIRRWIMENDWLEAIVALPEQLFYNTGISTYLWVLTN